MNVPSQQPSLQYPIRANSPYPVMQQQQGMLGGHGMMPNQPGMGNAGKSNQELKSNPIKLLWSNIKNQ